MLSEKGSLKDTPVMKLLLTVFELGLTGILYIKREDVLKVLYFSRGKMIWAISNSDADKLENILEEKGLTDMDTILKVKSESRVSESIGKLLVEKGLITLEELIEASRDQLKHIMVSVMKWKAGGFQFIKDAPPERLLSLDLNVTDFIIDYIVEEVDISDIWKEIGTLQLELIKNPDEEKLEKYKLSDKQNELLNSFDGEKKLEGILSRYSGGHRESLLKIIYFFMMAELLIKKEFELSDASVFDTGDISDYTLSPPNGVENDSPFETYSTSEISKVPDIGPPQPPQREEMPPFDLPSVEQFRQERKTEIESMSAVRFEKPDSLVESTPSFIAEAAKPEEKKGIKLFNAALILVFLILVFSGIILLVLPWMQDDTPTSTPKETADQTDIISIKEPETKMDSSENGGVVQEKVPDTNKEGLEENTTDNKEAEAKAAEKKNPPVKQPVQEAKPKNTVKEKPKEKEQTKPISGKKPRQYFLEGSLITAADIWKRELIAEKIKYTVLLELDCKRESVMHAFRLMNRNKEFFILNRKAGRTNCYLVMCGKFKTHDAATAYIKKIPNYFWKQKDPPEIVELSKYIR
jgi:Domain of unknown function (DUF4388)